MKYNVWSVDSLAPKAIEHWLEGTLLLAAYLVLGFAFYFHPVIPVLG